MKNGYLLRKDILKSKFRNIESVFEITEGVYLFIVGVLKRNQNFPHKNNFVKRKFNFSCKNNIIMIILISLLCFSADGTQFQGFNNVMKVLLYIFYNFSTLIWEYLIFLMQKTFFS